jgi:hypothetical protein
MESANDRELDHLAHLGRLHCARLRRVLVERQVGSGSVIVGYRIPAGLGTPESHRVG